MFGDILKKNLYKLKEANKKNFYKILIDLACEDLKKHKQPVSSDVGTKIYYKILKENKHYILNYFHEKLKNGQERFRVINRNIWSSNSKNKNGLTNRKNIHSEKKGKTLIYCYVD